VALVGQTYRCLVLVEYGLLNEARALASQVLRDAEASGNPLVSLIARLSHLEARLQQGETDAIDADAFSLGESPAMTPRFALWHLTVLAQILLAQRAELPHMHLDAAEPPKADDVAPVLWQGDLGLSPGSLRGGRARHEALCGCDEGRANGEHGRGLLREA
jgi:hypothetical protein